MWRMGIRVDVAPAFLARPNILDERHLLYVPKDIRHPRWRTTSVCYSHQYECHGVNRWSTTVSTVAAFRRREMSTTGSGASLKQLGARSTARIAALWAVGVFTRISHSRTSACLSEMCAFSATFFTY